MLFVPMSLVALNRVRGEDSGVASSLRNTGQQVGGAIGLAALGTVTWTAVSNNVKHQLAQAASVAGGRTALHPAAAKAGGQGPAPILHPPLALRVSRGFLLAPAVPVPPPGLVPLPFPPRPRGTAGRSPAPPLA